MLDINLGSNLILGGGNLIIWHDESQSVAGSPDVWSKGLYFVYFR